MELQGKKAVVLAEDLYEDLELWYPVLRLREAGAQVTIAGPARITYHSKAGYPAEADVTLDELSPDDFDLVVIPGGYAPDKMRRHQDLLDFVRGMHDTGRVVAFICHAGWVPISAGIVRDRTVTSVTAIRDDLINAGANWADREVVVDGNLISSRVPDDLPAFCREIIGVLAPVGAAAG